MIQGLPPPPPGFRGTILTDGETLRAASGSQGPIWIPPTAVVRPTSTEDVARIVVWAREIGARLVPRGAGTGMPGGNVGPGIVLDLAALVDVEPVAPGAETIEAGAGAIADSVDAVARRSGRTLPALPSSAHSCSVGGMVACNAAGARSFRFGAIHAQVVALEVVRTDGSVEWLEAGPKRAPGAWRGLRKSLERHVGHAPLAWPRVRKNSSGYALDRFLADGDPVQLVIGSEGTLAIVTRARLRTEPLPETAAAVLIGLPDVEALDEVVREAHHLGAAACEFLGPRLLGLGTWASDHRLEGIHHEGGLALLEFQGTPSHVLAGTRAALTLARTLGGGVEAHEPLDVRSLWEIRHTASPSIARAAERGLRSMQFIEDCVVPLAGLPSYLRGIEEILGRHETDGVVFGHAGDGNLHVNPLVDLTRTRWRDRVRHILEDTVELVGDLGGTLSGEHGDGRVRAPYLHRIWSADIVEGFQMVKTTLDPDGMLNPGVVLPLPGQDPLEGMGVGPDLQVANATGMT